MRLFGSERVMHMMETLGIDEDTPIDAKILSGAIENAQKTVESRNYQARKSVLEYDDVMNTQRKIIYEQRRQVLDGEDLQKSIASMMQYYVESYVTSAFAGQPHLEDRQAFFSLMSHFREYLLPERRVDCDRRRAFLDGRGADDAENPPPCSARRMQRKKRSTARP